MTKVQAREKLQTLVLLNDKIMKAEADNNFRKAELLLHMAKYIMESDDELVFERMG